MKVLIPDPEFDSVTVIVPIPILDVCAQLDTVIVLLESHWGILFYFFFFKVGTSKNLFLTFLSKTIRQSTFSLEFESKSPQQSKIDLIQASQESSA